MAFSSQITEIRDLTRTDSTSFTDAAIYRKANIVYKYLAAKISDATGHRNTFGKQAYSDLKGYAALSAGDSGFNGEYALPSDCIIPIRIEAKPEENQLPMVIYDQSESSESEWDSADMLSGELRMRFHRDSIFIRPLPESDVANGLYIEYIGVPADLSTGTDVPEFISLFHDVLTLGVCKRFFMRDPVKYTVELANMKNEYAQAEADMIQFFQDRLPKNLRINSRKEYQTESFK